MAVSDRAHRAIQLVAIGLTFFAVAFGLLVLWRHMSAVKKAPSETSSASAPAPIASAPPPPLAPPPVVRAIANSTLADSAGGRVAGAMQLAQWASASMTFADLSKVPETTLTKAFSTVGTERGKSICLKGVVGEIVPEQAPFGAVVHEGGIVSFEGGLRVVRVLAVGDVAGVALNDEEPQLFCGFVVGTEIFTNTQGQTMAALRLVGMFVTSANIAARDGGFFTPSVPSASAAR